MPRIASVIVLAAAATLTATASARDFITRISDTAWSVNGRMVQRMGNLVMWDTGSALITPSGVYGRNFDTIPGVIPGNPYGMFGNPGTGHGDCRCHGGWQRRLPSIETMNVDPLQPFRPANFGPMIGELGCWLDSPIQPAHSRLDARAIRRGKTPVRHAIIPSEAIVTCHQASYTSSVFF